jgi:hypothetical protein
MGPTKEVHEHWAALVLAASFEYESRKVTVSGGSPESPIR